MPYDVNKVIKIAKEELGYLEKKNGDLKYLFDKKANAGSANYTKYNYEMHRIYPEVMDYPCYWCGSFVSFCFMQAYGVADARKLMAGDFDDYTVAQAALYQKAGAWYQKPEIGDQIFFKNASRICHTGLVVDIIPSSKTVVTIEGNTSNGTEVVSNGGAVCRKYYNMTNPRIAGYGRPAYGKQFSYTPHWVRSGDNWYYRVGDGKNAHGWHTIDRHWYYFADDGKMLTGPQKIGSDWYMLTTREIDASHEGACMQSGPGGNLREWIV